MSTRRQSQKRLKKPPACDSCKARRVLCHPQPNNAPCPRCLEKNILCTTTPVVRGRPRNTPVKAHAQPTASTSLVVSPRELRLAVAVSLPSESALASNDSASNCPALDPEFVAHCFECFELISQTAHPLIRRTGIKESVHAASFDLQLLLPQSRVLALCIIAVTSLSSFHESVLGPGPRPQSFEDLEFFLSSPDLGGCGVRRAATYRALRANAVVAAREIGIMFEATEVNAASCFLLDFLEQTDTSGLMRPWAGAYISHIRALAPRWRAGKYTPSDEARWMGFLMSEALCATTRRLPMLITLHDQLLLAGPEPSLDSFLESLESKRSGGLQVLYSSMKPYCFHVICLARQLYLDINGDYPRLNPLSEAAVIKFLSSLSLLHSAASLLLARVDAEIGPSPCPRSPIRYEGRSVDAITRSCGYGVIAGFVSLVLPFYRELELRGDEGEPRTRERLRLFRMQAREIAVLGLHELARALRYLPHLHYTPVNWRIIYPWAEFCVEAVADREDLQMIVNELKLMGYSLEVFSTPQATELIERLEAYLSKPTSPQPAEDFLNSAELADLFLPLEQPWMAIPKGMIFDVSQQASGFPFNQFTD
ncbi:hypothetical protein B0H12DRAFT_1321427 [Mycena haematopus]|nr:hypothetical protein B0H12DRAFT_1321427 [Mycena haematopus]